MCRVTEYNIDGRTIRMADIKQKYIPNIIDTARKCDYIDKIILFDDLKQAYDVLYFKGGKTYDGKIMDQIAKGEVLYERQSIDR